MLYPKNTKTRTSIDLNGVWNFQLGEHFAEKRLEGKEVMVVPSSFNDVIVDKDKRNYIGDFWYERQIAVPNVDENQETPAKFNIMGVPSLLLFKDGKLIAQRTGMASKSIIKEWIESNI